MKQKYYSLKNILSKGCFYNVIFGQRSNGKTYSVLKYALEQYYKTGGQLAIIRRWQDDFRGKRGASMFDALMDNNEIMKITNGEWTGVYYLSSRWYLCRTEPETDKRVVADEPFAYGFAVSSGEHDKSSSFPKVTTIMFDEMLTRTYLPDEFVLFMNVLSTIIRQRDNVRIFMLGNTISAYCPYFQEMGLTNIKKMKPGDIDVYQYGDSRLTVAVEFADNPNKGKASDLYFAFDNPKLSMITGHGDTTWELGIYPHCPEKFAPKDIVFSYFIEFDGNMLQADIIEKPDKMFTFVHRKTGDIKDPDNDVIFSPTYDPRPNWHRKITKPGTNMEKKIAWFYQIDAVYYQDNEVGNVAENYLNWCRTSK